MKKELISIPIYCNLSKEENWTTVEKNQFIAIRLHFLVTEKQSCSKIYNGEILSGHSSPEGVGSETIIKETFEFDTININSRIIESVQKEEYWNNISCKLGSKLSECIGPVFDFNTNVEFGEKLLSEFRTQTTTSDTTHIKKQLVIENKITFDSQKNLTVYCVSPYKRMRCDVYLAYADYLLVDYRKGLLKSKRTKIPVAMPNEHTNRVIFDQQINSFEYWKLIDSNNQNWFIAEDKYEPEVDNPYEIIEVDFNRVKKAHIPLPKFAPEGEKTLYRISSKAFPLYKGDRDIDLDKDNLTHDFSDTQGTAKIGFISKHLK